MRFTSIQTLYSYASTVFDIPTLFNILLCVCRAARHAWAHASAAASMQRQHPLSHHTPSRTVTGLRTLSMPPARPRRRSEPTGSTPSASTPRARCLCATSTRTRPTRRLWACLASMARCALVPFVRLAVCCFLRLEIHEVGKRVTLFVCQCHAIFVPDQLAHA